MRYTGRSRRGAVVGLIAMGLAAACSDATTPDPVPKAGTVRVTTATTGPDPDVDGYTVTVDAGAAPAGRVDRNGSITLSDVPAGSHEVRLDGVATNCTVDGGAGRQVTVASGEILSVEFTVACRARVGSIAVSVVTTGSDLPANGYRLDVDEGNSRRVGANETLTLASVREGSNFLYLSDVAANCTLAGPNPRTVTVSFGETATAAFTVACVATRGTLQIITATTGADLDPDGYTARVAWGSSITTVQVPVAGTTNVTVAAGSGYVVSLLGVAANCAVDAQGWPGTTRHVDVAGGATVAASFAVTCEPISDPRLPPGSELAFVRDGKIYRVNSDGTGLVRLTDGTNDNGPAWSPDGKRIAFSRERGGGFDIFVMDADGSNVVRRTNGGFNFDPAWSPDGARIAFSGLGDGSSNVYVVSAVDDGKGATAVVSRAGYDAQPAWSPDGTRIAFASDARFYDFVSDIFVATLGTSDVAQLTNPPGRESELSFYGPAWSPDGRKLAVVACPYAYDTCGSSSIAVMNADGSGLTMLTSAREGGRPTWSPDGRMIAFSSGGSIRWVSADGSERGVILEAGLSPAWRP